MTWALDHVQVAAPRGCEAAARAFYGELLGLPELEKPDALRARGGAWFACGTQQLHVGVQEPFAPATKAHPGLRVARDELDALAERLAAAGHRVAWEDDGARFHTDDPWGNRLELLSTGVGGDVLTRALRGDERAWATAVLRERWGDEVIGGGALHKPAELPAVVAERDGERIGLATWIVLADEAELVTVDALRPGAGGALVEAVAAAARAARCRLLRVLTTNDNLPALRLYQRHGFALVALNSGAIAQARALKPSIPAAGHAGIPIRDELVLERVL